MKTYSDLSYSTCADANPTLAFETSYTSGTGSCKKAEGGDSAPYIRLYTASYTGNPTVPTASTKCCITGTCVVGPCLAPAAKIVTAVTFALDSPSLWTGDLQKVGEGSFGKELGIYDLIALVFFNGCNVLSTASSARRSVSVAFEATVSAAMKSTAESKSNSIAANTGSFGAQLQNTMSAVSSNMAASGAISQTVTVPTVTGVVAPTVTSCSDGCLPPAPAPAPAPPVSSSSRSSDGFCMGNVCGGGAIALIVVLCLVISSILIALGVHIMTGGGAQEAERCPEDTKVEMKPVYHEAAPELDNAPSSGDADAAAVLLDVTAGVTDDSAMDPDLHNRLETYFDRYDLDRSGNLNSQEELRQICVNLVYNSPQYCKTTDVSTVNAMCDAQTCDHESPMDLDTWKEWFKSNLYKQPTQLGESKYL